MTKNSRKSRSEPCRPRLTLEALEDRTLLTGVVQAFLDPASQLLQLVGDHGNNEFTVAPSPVPDYLRVAGNRGTFTSINSVAFIDFPLAGVKDITMTLLDGKDNVTVTGFSISGDLTIRYGNASDVFALPDFTAAHIIRIPTIPPPVPTISSASNLTLTGTAEAGNSVTVFLDGSQVGTTTANSSGAW